MRALHTDALWFQMVATRHALGTWTSDCRRGGSHAAWSRASRRSVFIAVGVAATGDVMEVVYRVMDEVASEGGDGEVCAVAAATRTLPLLPVDAVKAYCRSHSGR